MSPDSLYVGPAAFFTSTTVPATVELPWGAAATEEAATIARVKAERQARVEAVHKLGKALSALGWRGDEATTKKLLENAIASDVDYGADGSVTLTLSVSTEGVALTPKR